MTTTRTADFPRVCEDCEPESMDTFDGGCIHYWRDLAGEPTVVYDSRPATYDHIAFVRQLLLSCVIDLTIRAHVHDASKLLHPELEAFDKFTPLLRTVEYGTPEYEQLRSELGPALEHHYANNDHHPEHHADGIAGMTLMQLLEMTCDWMAASSRHPHGDPMNSIVINAERFGYGPELAGILANTVRALQKTLPPAPTEDSSADDHS